MDGSYITLITVTFALLLIGVQRIEAKRRKLLRRIVWGFALVLWAWRWHLRNEHVIGILLAAGIAYLFWLFIGRYNPVGDSDAIKVYGMDD